MLTHQLLGIYDEVKLAVLSCFRHTDKSVYGETFQSLVKRWDKCINVAGLGDGDMGDYVEK